VFRFYQVLFWWRGMRIIRFWTKNRQEIDKYQILCNNACKCLLKVRLYGSGQLPINICGSPRVGLEPQNSNFSARIKNFWV
jgi:hypothetical protein